MLARPAQRLTLAIAVAISLVGCGGGDGDQDTTPRAPAGQGVSSTVEVTALDISFPVKEYTAKAGMVKLVYRNEGQIVHTLVIEEVPTFDKLQVNNKGDTDQGSVELEPGTYTVFCDVPGHRAAGMEAKLVVS